MKKIGLLVIFGMIFFGFLNQIVMAESWDYLPGGDNYLNDDNFVLNGGYVSTTHPFIIKSNQDYIFTVLDDYHRMFGPYEILVEISYYDNDTLLSTQEVLFQEFVLSIDFITLSAMFHTPLNANKLGFRILDSESYYETNGFSSMILEEGTTFDSFEDFIYGTIVDTTSPEFQNINTITSYVHSPILVADIQASLCAIDTIDGDVSSRITIVSDNYTPNMDTLGSYSILFQVTDLSGNTNQAQIHVEVIDVLKPEFSEIDPIPVPFGSEYSVIEILAMLHASDNYDGDISSIISLVEDNYTPNKLIVGNYTMTFSVMDTSGNTATKIVEVHVIDEVAPIITGDTSIVIGYDETITISEILDNFTVTDNYDSSLSFVTVSDNYSANKYIIGSYEIQFSVTDSSDNTTTVTVNIDVVDEIGPIVYFDSSIIQTYSDTVLALGDFLHLLSITKEISSVNAVNVKVIYDSYSSHASIPGVYHLKLKIGNTEEDSFEKDFQIIVKDSTSLIYEPQTNEVTFFQKYRNYIIFGSIGIFIIASNLTWFIILKRR